MSFYKNTINKIHSFITYENTFVTITRLLASLAFLISAIGKIIAIDNFEVFVFSLGFFSFDFSSIATRLLIGLELFLSLAILSRIYNKLINVLTIIILLGFTAFITLKLNNSSEHCHCFGDLIELNNTQTIIKNIILIGLSIVLIIFGKSTKYKLPYTLITTILLFAIPFIASTPDVFIYNQQTENNVSNVEYNPEVFYEYYNSNDSLKQYKIMCFISTGCDFCKLATKKLNVIANKTNSTNKIHFSHWSSNSRIKSFYKELNVSDYTANTIEPNKLLQITKGSIPRIFLIKNDTIFKVYGLRDMNEEIIIEHLRN